MNNFWKNIWDSKGKSGSNDLLFLDGYEHLKIKFSSKEIVTQILGHLDATPPGTILEVGCGAGFLAREIQDFHYTGIDYSVPIIEKHKELFPHHNVMVSEASSLPFADDAFDHVFCYGLFQYLPDRHYADKTIQEMERVCKSGIFLGDLKSEKTRDTHFVYPAQELQEQGFEISACMFGYNDVERFNAFKCKGKL
jgi:ubiquinone/menaquinone biosynthesis C-methylase UbiE